MSTPTTLPERSTLDTWLASHGWQDEAHEPLAGDVGHRRYRRLRRADGETIVLALHPAQLRQACRRFLATSALLTGAGVRVPQVVAADCELGTLLVEYLGDDTLNHWAETRSWNDILPRFRAALAAARRIAALDPEPVADLSPPLDAQLLTRELRLTREKFLEPRGLLEGDAGRRVEVALEALADSIAEVPMVPCHRDFMVRNLMPWPSDGDDHAVAVLDHQDLRLGPPLYDLASLLNDSLFPPPEIERQLVEEWCGGEDRWLEYHRVAGQRTLKAVGSYAMAFDEGKTFHEHRIGPTFERALDHLSKVPETAASAGELRRRWQTLDAGAMLTS